MFVLGQRSWEVVDELESVLVSLVEGESRSFHLDFEIDEAGGSWINW